MSFLNKCWQDVFQILAALGSLGTFGAFIFLFKKDKEKQKQINTLSEIAEIAAKRLKYQAAPKLWLNGAGYRAIENQINIDLNNKGKRARLTRFEKLEGQFSFISEYLPWDLEENGSRNIFIIPNNSRPFETYYKVAIYYTDDIGTAYKMIIEGTGANVEILSDEEIKVD